MHTYIFSILPVIQLYFQNCLEVNLWHILGIIGIICVVNASIYHGLSFFFKKHRPAIAILVSLWWIIFWFAIPVAKQTILNFRIPFFINAHKWLIALILSASALVLLFILLLYFRRYCEAIHKSFKLFGFITSALIIISGLSNFQKLDKVLPAEGPVAHSDESHPNVYHILFDAYTNYDILKEEYGYDNAAFYQALEDLGFVCFPSSQSNHPGTLLSMSSVLNFGLIHEEFYSTVVLTPALKASLRSKINNNSVWPSFIKNNYRLHLLDHTGIYKSNPMVRNTLKNDTFQRTALLITNRTLLKHIILNLFLKHYYALHIGQIKEILNHLQETPQEKGLTHQYTYAHILCPHEPFVFDEHGGVSKNQTFEGFIVQKLANLGSDPEGFKRYKQSYVNQVKALNKLVLPVIKSILKQHAGGQPPVIILHGDHGKIHSKTEVEQHPSHSLSNLFAIYVPEEWREEAKTLEFINLYRFICNHLFGTKYPYQESQYFYWKPLLMQFY